MHYLGSIILYSGIQYLAITCSIIASPVSSDLD